MVADAQMIEVDEATARSLKEQADRRGISVAEIVAELLPLAVDADAIAELDRRWASVRQSDDTVPHEKVAHWLETWGTSGFKPWRDQ